MKEPKTPSVLPRLKVGGTEVSYQHCDRNEQPVPDCDYVITTPLIILKYLPEPPTRSGDISKKSAHYLMKCYQSDNQDANLENRSESADFRSDPLAGLIHAWQMNSFETTTRDRHDT